MTTKSERDLILSMDTETLRTFIDNKTQRRDDLWRDAVELEQEADRMKKAGNNVNWELSIARVELRKRAEGGK